MSAEKTESDSDSYHFAIVADFIRTLMIRNKISFSFETVFSHGSKLQIIDLAHSQGYKVYLYFIGTKSYLVNIERVSDRIKKGGHAVDPVKIEDRYYRTMNLLFAALKKVDEAYIWDNSNEEHEYIALFKSGSLSFQKKLIPNWVFTYILDKIAP